MTILSSTLFPPLKKGGQGGFNPAAIDAPPKIPLNPPFPKGEAK